MQDQLFSPSFSSYTSDRLSDIALKVSDQYNRESRLKEDQEAVHDENDDDDDFEFSLVRDDDQIEDSANEVILDGKIRPIFPVFNRDLLIDDGIDETTRNSTSTIRLPLKKLFVDESEATSCSSSEADEFDSIAPGTYCVWRPKIVEPSPSTCKKSNSTGSVPKRWNLLHLLRRINSDGKDSFVFLTPKNRGSEKSGNGEKVDTSKARPNSGDALQVAGKVKPRGVSGGEKSSPHEVFYVQNRAMKEGYKRKSYLPYKPDLVGFFANVGALGPAGKSFPPF